MKDVKWKANKPVNCPAMHPAAFTKGQSASTNLLHDARSALRIMTVSTLFFPLHFFPITDPTTFCTIFPKISVHITLPSISSFSMCFPPASARSFQEMFHFRPGQQRSLHSNLSRPSVGPIHPPIQTLQVLFPRR
jgi:hypothetical protein